MTKYGSVKASPGSLKSPDIQEKHESTPIEAFSTTLKCIVGSGICALPFAIANAGWFSGLIGMIGVSLVSSYTMVQICLCVQMAWALEEANNKKLDVEKGKRGKEEKTSEDDEPSPIGYRQLGQITYGEWGRVLVDVVLLVAQVAGNCAFVAFSATNISSVLAPYPMFTELVVILAIIPILIVVCIPRSTAFLAPTSTLGNLALVVGLITVFVQCGHIIYERTDKFHTSIFEFLFSNNVAFGGYGGIFTFLGIAAYSLCSHAEVVAIMNDVEDKKGYPKMLTITMIAVSILYVIGGFVPYLVYKTDTKSIIFLNLPAGFFVSTVKLSMAIVVLFQYPMTLVPAVRTLDELILVPFITKEDDETTSLLNNHVNNTESSKRIHEILETGKFYWAGNVIRITIVVSTCFVAYFATNFGILASVVGSVFGGLICFVFPAMFYSKLLQLHNKWNYGYGIYLTLQCIFGFALMITGVFTAI